jgi:hypothetical protein
MEENYRKIVKGIREGRIGNGEVGEAKTDVDEGAGTDGNPQGPEKV